MDTEKVEQFIYGAWRPWTSDGVNALMAAHQEFTDTAGTAKYIDWWHKVRLPDPFNRHSFAYHKMLIQAADEMHNAFLCKMDNAEKNIDRKYVFKRYIRRLKNYLEDIAARETGEDRLTTFVLKVLLLTSANQMVDASLKYGHHAPKYCYDIETIFLDILNRTPAEGSFFFTAAWFSQQVKRLLKQFKNDGISQTALTAFLNKLAEQLASAKREGEQWQKLHAVRRYLENGLFLIKVEASFLDDGSNEIADPAYCAEWIDGMKEDMMQLGGEEFPVERVKTLYAVRQWLLNVLRPLNDMARDVPLSRAYIWMEELDRAQNLDRSPVDQQTGNESLSEVGDSDFTAFFNRHFVHKSEVEQAMGVHGRTLESYLAEGEVSRLKLKANTWYNRDDLEKFYDDELE